MEDKPGCRVTEVGRGYSTCADGVGVAAWLITVVPTKAPAAIIPEAPSRASPDLDLGYLRFIVDLPVVSGQGIVS